MADSSWVIRLEADNGATPILVKISRKEGGHDLDLDLLATDGDAAYAGKGTAQCAALYCRLLTLL